MQTEQSKLLNKTELCSELCVSARTLENMVKAGHFPPPVKIGKHVYWSAIAVRNWRQSMFAAQENWKNQPKLTLGFLPESGGNAPDTCRSAADDSQWPLSQLT